MVWIFTKSTSIILCRVACLVDHLAVIDSPQTLFFPGKLSGLHHWWLECSCSLVGECSELLGSRNAIPDLGVTAVRMAPNEPWLTGASESFCREERTQRVRWCLDCMWKLIEKATRHHGRAQDVLPLRNGVYVLGYSQGYLCFLSLLLAACFRAFLFGMFDAVRIPAGDADVVMLGWAVQSRWRLPSWLSWCCRYASETGSWFAFWQAAAAWDCPEPKTSKTSADQEPFQKRNDAQALC